MKATPTQLKRIADLLVKPASDVDTLAEQVWNLVDELMSGRNRYTIFAYHPSLNLAVSYGPYNTELQARRDAPKRIADTGGTQVRIVKLLDPDNVTE